MSDNTITATDETFDEIVASETPTVVDFWAEWCGPCRMVSPILDEIAQEYKGSLTVAKLNVDENPQIAMQYDVMSIPTIILFKEGQEKKRLVGARPKGALVEQFSEFV